MSGVSTVGPVEVLVHAETPVTVSRGGIGYAQVSSKGKPMPQAGCLAGFQHLEIVDAAGTCRFRLDDHVADLLAGRQDFTVEGAAKLRFTRRQVMYHDLVKGDLAKPLDSLRDFVIVRGDGNPVFHLANVCDDVTQQITHIIRGDDHVESPDEDREGGGRRRGSMARKPACGRSGPACSGNPGGAGNTGRAGNTGGTCRAGEGRQVT